jgi:hypothetical protein
LRVLHLFASFLCHSDCLSCASFIYLSPCSSSCCASPFYLLLMSHCIARPLSVVCAHFCFVVHRGRRGEEGGSDSLASWEDKKIDMVASSWRYFSTQSIISLHRPIILPSVRRRCDHPNQRSRRACRRSTAIKEHKTAHRPLTGRTYAVAPTSPSPVPRG